MHPKREIPYFNGSDINYQGRKLEISLESLSKAINTAPTGSSPGLTKWRYEFLKALLTNDSARQLLCFDKFAEMILQAKDLPDFLVETLRIGNLFGTIKPDGSTRPIALIDILRRWLTKAVAFQYKKEWASCLGRLQYAVGISAGVEKIVHTLNTFIEVADNDLFCVGEADCRNAFNCCNREMFMTNLQTNFPELFPFFYLWYSGESKLIFEMENGSKQFILSSEGTTQGDPGAMFLFCVGLKTPLTNIAKRAPPQSMIVSFADNINLGSKKEDFNILWQITEEELAAYHLKVRRDKSYVYPLHSGEHQIEVHNYPEGIQILYEGFKSLGIPIGSEAFIEEVLNKKLKKNENLINGIIELDDLQIGGLLLRYCANSRINYWNRILPPQSLAKQNFLENHDKSILNCFKQIHRISSVDDSQRVQIALPLSMGGMGLLSAFQHSKAAYIGSVTETVKEIWDRNKEFFFMSTMHTMEDMNELQWIKFAEESWFDLNQMLKVQDPTFEGLMKWDINELCKTTTSFDTFSQGDSVSDSQTKRMQSILSHHINKAKFEQLLSSTDNRFKKRLLSAGGIGSAGFLYAIPCNPTLVMTNMQMEIAVKLRIGCEVCSSSDISNKCLCGQQIDKFGDHFLVCKNGSEKFNRHNMWLHSWERLIKKSTSPSLSLEKPLYALGITQANNFNKRIDLVEHKINEQSIMADVSITHPTSANLTNQNISTPGYAALTREKEKHKKYDESATKLNMKFVPLIAETYGRMGLEAISYAQQKINELSTVFSINGPKIDRRTHQRITILWWTTLSVSLQKGNAHIVMSKKFKILRPSDNRSQTLKTFDMNDLLFIK